MSMDKVKKAAEAAPASRRTFGRITPLVLAFCWATIIIEGYDAGIYGVVVPSLLQHPTWGLTPGSVGVLGSLGPAGMVLGSLAIGTLTDIVGRRKTVIGCLIAFSVITSSMALAPSPEVFGLLRFLAGIGLGGVIPTAAALTGEYAPIRVRNLAYMLVFTGFPLGGLLAAWVGIGVIPSWGWQPMFALALVPLLVFVPLALRYLPESIGFLQAKGRHGEAQRIAARFGLDMSELGASNSGAQSPAPAEPGKLASLRTIGSRRYRFATACFWATMFMALFATWSITTWLPQLMRQAGYELGSALTFLVVFNLGAVVGMLVIGTVADRIGSKRALIMSFLGAAASVALLSVALPPAAAYLLVWFAGAAVIGLPGVINGYVSKYYPVHVVATALGWSLGIGRLGAIAAPVVIGLLVGSTLGSAWNFFVIAFAALIGAFLSVFVPKPPGIRTQAATSEQSEAQAATIEQSEPQRH